MKSEPDLSGGGPPPGSPRKKPMLGNIDARRFSLAYPEKSSGRAVIHDAGRSEENDWCQCSIAAFL